MDWRQLFTKPDSAGRSTDELISEGYECLRNYDYDEVLKIARLLRGRSNIYSIDLEATALERKGKRAKAIRLLSRGVRRYPRAWLLWELLGNYYSDSKKYQQAEEAYRRGLQCPGAYTDSLVLNLSLVLERKGEYGESLRLLERVTDTKLRLRKASQKLSHLMRMKAYDEGLQLAEECLAEDWDAEENWELLARISAEKALMGRKLGKDAQQIKSDLWKAIPANGCSDDILNAIRVAENDYREGAKYFRLAVHFNVVEGHPLREYMKGYVIEFDVIDVSLEGALEAVKAFERLRNYENPVDDNQISIYSSEILRRKTSDPLGIYWYSKRIGYTE